MIFCRVLFLSKFISIYIKVRVAAGSNTRKVSQITKGMMSTGDGQESLELGDSVADNSPPLNGTGREDASANGF
jgi:hypothetical protein